MRRVIPAAMLVLVLVSCRGESADSEESEAPSAPPPAAAASPGTAATAGPQLTGITEKGSTVTIAYTENGAEQELYGELRDNGKRKYTLDDGPTLYEIKPGDDGFKVRNADGSLRWKVKFYPDKIKISNNEENKDPYELKSRGGNRMKVVAPGDRELGNVRYAAEKIDVENASGQVIFSKRSAAPSGAYGVLLLDAIPARERYILVAELLARAK